MEVTREIKKGAQVKEYRKIGLRWCKMSRMMGIPEAELKRYLALYKQYLQSGGEPLLKETI